MKKSAILNSILAALFGVLIGGAFLALAGYPVISSIGYLFSAGFGCQTAQTCAFLTALQFATPLVFAGLAAAVTFRAGFFNIGQAGQMILGAGVAAYIGGIGGIEHFHPFIAIATAALIGGIWALVPGLLKVYLNVNEIITSLVMNSIAVFMVGMIPLRYGPIEESARLSTLATGTKLNSGLFMALIALLLIYLVIWRTSAGYSIRMTGQSPRFAKSGGIDPVKYAVFAFFLSGMLAGVAGSIEVLGVHYRFVTGFSADVNLDGVMVALLGNSHPLGILLAALFVGGIRLGSLNGLLIVAGVPRELGNAILASMMIFMSVNTIRNYLAKRSSNEGL